MKHINMPKIEVLDKQLWNDPCRNRLQFTINKPAFPEQNITVLYYGATSHREVSTDIHCLNKSIDGDALYDLIVLLTNIYSGNVEQYYEQAKR